MKRIGIIGFGFMGNMHFNNYAKIEGVKVAAICDIVKDKLTGKGGAAGNIAGADKPLDLTGVDTYTDAAEMFKSAKLDAVSITLPTYLHKQYTIMALEAGLDVLCEKPMAMNEAECNEMMAAADKAGNILQIGHCIRFWPEYAKTKEIIDSGKYGKVNMASFHRLSLTPTWSWDNWLMDEKRSGGAVLDLHIHDADYIQYLFGMPKAVFSSGNNQQDRGGYGHILTQYIYGDNKVITAEGGWVMTPSFGFEMSYEIALDTATITYDCTKSPTFKVCPIDGEAFTPELAEGDGYMLEMIHFVSAINGNKVPQIITPEQSKNSVLIVAAEKKSADSVEKVML